MTYHGMTFTAQEIAEMLPKCPVCGGMLGKLPKAEVLTYECKYCGLFYKRKKVEGKA